MSKAFETDELVFKYRIIDADTLSSIHSGHVWFASREQLNDPYDCFPQIENDLSENKLKELFNSFKYEFSGETKAEKLIELFEKSSNDLMNRLGVFCVTQNPLNELMWAHYADSHQGIVIGYRLKPENMNNKEHPHRAIKPVSYNERAVARLSDFYSGRIEGCDDAYNRWMKALYFSKTPAWSYEEELRFLSIRSNGLKDIDASIEEVHFGARTTSANKEMIVDLMGHSVNFYEVKLSPHGLLKEPYTKP